MKNLIKEEQLAEAQALTYELTKPAERKELVYEELSLNSSYCMAYFIHYLSTDLHQEFLQLLEEAKGGC